MSTLTMPAIEEPIPYTAAGAFAPPVTSAPDRVLPSLIDESAGDRRIWLGVALAICGLYAVAILSFWAPADGGVDQNAYLVGGRMIASHFTTRFDPPDAFAYIGHMFDRSAAGKFYPKYPFGLPLLYAITIWILGPAKALSGAFLISPICAILAVLGTFFLARLIAGSFAAVMAAILLATSQVMLELANTANSHASCVAFVVWGMYALVRWWQTDDGPKHHLLGILGGFLIGYAGTIRYSEGLLVLAIAVACASRVRWTNWRSYLRSSIPGLAWAVPIATMLIYNKLSLGDWTGYDSTSESEFGAAFTWAKFVATWEEMLRVLHDMGLFFVLPFGVAGLAMLFRRNWKLALMLVMWALPGVALYTSYYWSPERGIAYGRFFLTFFPAFLVGAAVCFRDGILGGVQSDEHSPGESRAAKIPMCIAIGLVVAISSGVGLYRSIQGMESGTRGASEDLGDQLRNRANLAMTGKTIFQAVPEGSVLFTEQGGMGNSPINYLQFIQNWNLFSIDAFSPAAGRRGVGRGPGGGPPGGFGGQGGPGANGAVTQDTPSPMQPRLREYFASIYKDKSSADLLKEQRRVVDDALASGKRVFAAVTPLHLQTLKTALAADPKAAKYDFKRIAQWRDMPAPTPETPVTPNGGGFGGPGGRRGGFGGAGGGRMAMMDRGQVLSWTLVEITLAK